ncbi:MAG: transcription antitermination factor NusB [Solobacterium sp.]|jgi:N utilization substance protein B|nr:transcription antitermination factor NusB [Solobacterium sp.]MBR3343263.1 transcription antitermination factor NusB [Solobacterium sp.]HAE16101.1 transcription antitermination factor NusB [Erysipelotrichaceae bacterium]
MKRHESREKGMITVYQYLLFRRDLEELIDDNFENKEDEYILQAVRTAALNEERYIGYLNRVLEGWTFDRLGVIEQAIMLMGCAEFDMKQLEMNVIIDEYVRLAKKYCEPDSYKLINGVLDRI